MIHTNDILPGILDAAQAADLTAIRSFLTSNPSEPLVATGSGGSESAADFAALLYGARCGMSLAVSPYALISFSNGALMTGKILLVSKGGHNNDIVFAARRALDVCPARTAMLCFYDGDRNETRKLFLKAGSDRCFSIPMPRTHEGFVSSGTSYSNFAILTRIFQPDVDLAKYKTLPEHPFTLCLNDGTPMAPEDFAEVKSFFFMHGSWGRPVAKNLEGKIVETGIATGCICDYRNYCHGRFIHTSNHLEDSAVVMFISPREKDIAARTRAYLPAKTKLVLIETEHDAPEASLDLLIRASEFFHSICPVYNMAPTSPRNPGRIDKRKPMWVPFMAELKRNGPLSL
jgi:fructoselysine-6-P-deglycase FrlB-like protein